MMKLRPDLNNKKTTKNLLDVNWRIIAKTEFRPLSEVDPDF
jgi:hypothetical protein